MFVVEFLPRAARQMVDAREWWREHREKAPDAFDEDFAGLLTMLEHMPRAEGAPVAQRPGVRRAVLRRVRYNVYFIVEESTVLILAVWHASRGTPPNLRSGLV
jgi:plasmid stabilization system protein ParE